MTEWIGDLSYMLRRLGFGPKGGGGSKSMSSAKFSIMINGSSQGYCSAHLGLRQGDPLSSVLFTIAREPLSRMISAARKSNLISGFSPTSKAPRITHLQFAEDTIIFCAAEEDQVKYVLAVIRCFEAVWSQGQFEEKEN